MTSKQLGKKIREARSKMGLTQADLAYRIGISAVSISAFESGRIHPARKYIEKIAQFTHQPIYFFTGEKVEEALGRVEKMIQELEELKSVLQNLNEDSSDT